MLRLQVSIHHRIALLATFCLGVVSATILTAQPLVQTLRTQNLENPMGIDEKQPRLSWQLSSEKRNMQQAAYEIEMRSMRAPAKPFWQTGKQASPVSTGVDYTGPALQSNTTYRWKVRIWDQQGNLSPWSREATFQTGLLSPTDWKAKWIGPGYTEDSVMRPSPLMRKAFAINKRIQQATLFATAHGMYEARINGQRVGEDWLTPGWTSYHTRLQYQAYDVTGMVQQGQNALGVVMGNGWYRGTIGFSNKINAYGKELSLLLQLHVTYTDGSSQIIATDESWKSSTGAIRYSEIYHGEIIDSRLAKKDWDMPGYNDAEWSGVKIATHGVDKLIATINEPVRQKEVFKPLRIFTTPAGEQVIDFGQNVVGWVRIKVNGNKGDSLFIKHAEVLDKHGNMYYDNLRAAQCRNVYISNGEGEATFHPHFTWQGFRYAAIKGYPGPLTPDKVEAVALYSHMELTGNFSSSHALINQLQHNIQWGQRGNFLDVPTDCPQRDERLGWTGDAQAFSPTAAFNFNVQSFFGKWLQDLEADQVKGAVPFVIPNVLNATDVNSAGWADAATIIPWNMYLAYADTPLLKRQYNSMKAYVESIRAVAKNNLWNTGFHFGDWLFYRPDDDNDGRAAVTDKYLIAQCFYAHSTQLLAQAAAVLGYKQEESQYRKLHLAIQQAFEREYMTPQGRLVSGTQTAYVLTLQFGMIPLPMQQQAADRLAKNIESYGHISTGFLGTPYICHVLTKYGYHHLAVKLLLREQYPSWLYPVKMGATTIWERWDGMKPDSSFQTPGMNSFNHYAYGAIGDWLYRVVAGIGTHESGPGYSHIIINPHPVKELGHVQASLRTPYGIVSSNWKPDGSHVDFAVEIPANTRATIFIPAPQAALVQEGGKPLTEVFPASEIHESEGRVYIRTGSGKYQFRFAGE